MKKYSAFLFDLDGTLINSNAHVVHCFQEAFIEVTGTAPSVREITATFGIPLQQAMQQMHPDDWETLLKTYRACSDREGYTRINMIDGADTVMHALRQMQCRIAVVTSKKRDYAWQNLTYFGLAPYVEVLIGPEDTPRHKPDPQPVQIALNRLQVAAEDALMIGDSPHDIQSGQRAGIDTCGLSFTAVSLQDLCDEKPTYMLDRLQDLLPMAASH